MIWQTKVTLPNPSPKAHQTFLEMIHKVALVAGVPRYATWKSESINGITYVITAEYEKKPYPPWKPTSGIKFKLI